MRKFPTIYEESRYLVYIHNQNFDSTKILVIRIREKSEKIGHIEYSKNVDT